MGKRTVKESPVARGVKETYAYQFILTDKVPSGTYTAAANSLYEQDANGEYLAAVSDWNNGSPAVLASVFTTSKFSASILTAGKTYRLECSIAIDGDVWDWNLFINVRN